jgi:hypothetical protein
MTQNKMNNGSLHNKQNSCAEPKPCSKDSQTR